MNLLARAILGLRKRTTAGLGVVVLIVCTLIALEILGRRSTSDLHDLLALAAMMPIFMLIVAYHKRTPVAGLAVLTELGHRALDAVKGLTFQMGLDFRGEPRVKRGLPPIIRWPLFVMFGAVTLLAVLSPQMPHGIRTVVMPVTYLGYLVLLVGLWVALALAILLVAFVSLAIIHDTFVHRQHGARKRPRLGLSAAVAIWFGMLAMLGVWVPLRFAPILCLALGAAYMLGALTVRRFVVQILWRPYQSIKVRSMTWSRWVSCQFMLIGLSVLALILTSCGALIHGDELAYNVMPLTCLLGAFLSWLGPGLLALLCTMTVLSRRRDPSRHAVPVAHVTIHRDASSQSEVRRLFARRGWKTSFAPALVNPLDVRVEIAAESLPLDRPSDQWPLIITRDDLDRDGLFVRLSRRDEIQKRRRFLSGLETLMKHAKRRSDSGCGYWLSPQYWFVAGLMRDTKPGEDEADSELGESPILSACIGPPYHRIFPQSVRKHLFDVLRGTEIDLIFIEDGIGYKKIRRAIRVLFEVFDVHGGRRRAEDIDFRGLPGLRAMIHDFQFDDPFKAKDYPEPKYDFLGRARILHIFRDRGGDEELIEPPFDYDRQPAPFAVC